MSACVRKRQVCVLLTYLPGDVDPDRADVVRVGVHVCGEDELHLWAVAHPDVRVADLIKQRLDLGEAHLVVVSGGGAGGGGVMTREWWWGVMSRQWCVCGGG
jgi:hypothetical protein